MPFFLCLPLPLRLDDLSGIIVGEGWGIGHVAVQRVAQGWISGDVPGFSFVGVNPLGLESIHWCVN